MSEEMIKNIEKMDLESAMKRLEVVAEAMSKQNVSLEESLALYEEGIALVRACTAKIDGIERRINELRTTADGEVLNVPFATEQI